MAEIEFENEHMFNCQIDFFEIGEQAFFEDLPPMSKFTGRLLGKISTSPA